MDVAYKKYLISFLVLIIGFNIASTALSSGKYTTFSFWNGFKVLKQTYLDSQYVNKNPKGWIPDEIVNSYAGAEYIRGVSPILIAPDTPPLGRYLIGLSEVIFNNENIISLFFSITSLLLMYFLGKEIFSPSLLAMIPPFLFSFEPIFKNQIIYSPLLDIMQLTFLLGCFYFFNKGIQNKNFLKYFIIANIFLGLFISTKFFITGLTIVAAWFLVVILRKYFSRIKILIITLPISIFILLTTYAKALMDNPNLIKFFGIQKYVFLYHKSQLILPLSIWPLLLINRWFVWYGDKPVISDPQWLITWPVITICSILTIFLYIFKRFPHNNSLEVLMAWVLFYFAFFSFGQITSRYFVILIPVLYIISIYGIVELLKLKFPKFRKLLI